MTRWVAFVSVGVGASQRIPLSVLTRNPHIGLAREISHETGRRWKKETIEKGRAEQGSQQERAVSRRELLIEVGRSRRSE